MTGFPSTMRPNCSYASAPWRVVSNVRAVSTVARPAAPFAEIAFRARQAREQRTDPKQ